MNEASLIEGILRRCPTGPALVGPGDDAAVVEASGPVVITTDTLVEGVHFRRDWLSAAELAWRLVRVNLSDLAAMGAVPHTALLSLVGNPEDYPDEFAAGLGEALRSAGLILVGGNVSAGAGQLVLTLTATGVADRPLLRSGASVGDGLWVSGDLGLAGAGVAALSAGQPDSDPDAVAAWRRPPDRVEIGRALVGRASACMDLSDGLAADLPRLCKASSVGAVVAVDAVPGRQEYKLAAGEDYELLVAASPLEDLRDLGLTRIGQVETSGIVRFVNGRGESVNTGEGFDHFGRPSPC